MSRRLFSSYQQLYQVRKPQRGGDEVGAKRKDIYAYDVVPIRDETMVWAYSLPNVVSVAQGAPEAQRAPPTDVDGLRRFDLLRRLNTHLLTLAS